LVIASWNYFTVSYFKILRERDGDSGEGDGLPPIIYSKDNQPHLVGKFDILVKEFVVSAQTKNTLIF
jgi:hypothetical protein